jgi:hypothetical protein
MAANFKVSEFASALQGYFPRMHGARRKFLENIVPAIAQASSVTPRRIARAFAGRAREDSVMRRIQRFLALEPHMSKAICPLC